MATDLAAVAQLIKEHYETPFTEAMNRSLSMYNFFPRKAGVADSVAWKVHYPGSGGSNATSYSESDALTATDKQFYLAASRPFKMNYVGIEVTRFAQAATAGAGGFMEALANDAREALENFKDKLNTQLLSASAPGNSGKDIDGFAYIINDKASSGGVNVYAGIDRSTYSFWESYVQRNGGTGRPLTLALLQNVVKEMAKPSRSGAKINRILSSYKHWFDYGNMLDDQRRWVDTKSLDWGFSSISYNGIEWIAVPDLADGAVYALDTRDWAYYILQNFETSPQAVNTDADRFVVTHYSQLICKHPGRQAKIVDLS
jgi:hypothetical protein